MLKIAVFIKKPPLINMRKCDLFVGNIIDCRYDGSTNGRYTLRKLVEGFVAVKDGKIIAIGEKSDLYDFSLKHDEMTTTQLTDTQILIPGLIDTHIHAPQYPNCGLGYDKTLMDWLQTYTYPTELMYKDPVFSEQKKTLSHGTTTASYFGTLFTESCMILADIIENLGQRAFVGKVNMERMAPSNYTENINESIQNTKQFVEYVLNKKNDLVKPIITPRFGPSCSSDMLEKLGKLAKEYDAHIQSHISENKDEIAFVKNSFKKKYASIYDDAALLTPKTIMAHGVHLDDDEMKLLAERKTGIAHCPQSNTNLRSGFCDVRRLWNAGVNVGLGTDVSGGEVPSIIAAMKSAIENSIHISFVKPDYTPLNYKDAFYLATLGGAKALAMDKKIGNFEEGKDFDAVIMDANVENSNCDLLMNRKYDALEILQKIIYTGDDRNVKYVYVAGRCVK